MDAITARQKIKLPKIIIGFIAGLTAMTIIVSSAGAQSVSFPNSPTDCDSNAVVHCGVLSADAALKAYNASSYVQKIYERFHITSTMMQQLPSSAVAGTVTKSGNVLVKGKTIATGALTAGRLDIPGSTKVTVNGITFYKRPPSVSFKHDTLDAYVMLGSKDQFLFAILASCGNPVTATPIATPTPKPKPVPTPTPAPTPTPVPPVTQIVPQPQATCDSLALDKISDRTYRATVQSTTSNGAQLSSIVYDFGDNVSIPATTSTTMVHTYQQDSNYQVTANVSFTTPNNGQIITAQCMAQITVTTPAPPAPAKPVATPPVVLPNTGAGNVVGLFIGAVASGAFAYRWYLARHLKTST